MATTTPGGADFDALARQYWTAWGDTMRGAAAPEAAHAGAQAWREAVDWWTQLVHGQRAEVNAAVDRFTTQARSWYGQMQQVAARFAGSDAGAAEIADAWKQALGAVGENPFPELFRTMRGQGQKGLDQWIEDASPFLEAWRREGNAWLGLPAFGHAREHQERWQALARAQLDYQEQASAYSALLSKAAQRAHALFEEKLAERAEPGRQLTSVRAMFDLWIDAAEEAYAEIALSPEFRTVYGALVDAQMRVRAGVQKEIEQVCDLFGMPTRTEVDAAHRKIAQLERELRRLRQAAQAGAVPTQAAAAATTTKGRAKHMDKDTKQPSTKARPSAQKADGSLKLSGDPLTGPRRAAEAPKASAKKTPKADTTKTAATKTPKGKRR